ncbi:MAG: hypothetical protein IV092_14635 [Burkholderiaceae bacterium]|nr:hypothetical protein [Burkholderiaceae bacterium]
MAAGYAPQHVFPSPSPLPPLLPLLLALEYDMPGMVMMNELIDAVERSADLSPQQATEAVGGMLRFLASRLPSPLFGELQSRLNTSLMQDVLAPESAQPPVE